MGLRKRSFFLPHTHDLYNSRNSCEFSPRLMMRHMCVDLRLAAVNTIYEYVGLNRRPTCNLLQALHCTWTCVSKHTQTYEWMWKLWSNACCTANAECHLHVEWERACVIRECAIMFDDMWLLFGIDASVKHSWVVVVRWVFSGLSTTKMMVVSYVRAKWGGPPCCICPPKMKGTSFQINPPKVNATSYWWI